MYDISVIHIPFQFHIQNVHVCVVKLQPPLRLIILNNSQIHSLGYLIKTIRQTGDRERKTIRPFVNLFALSNGLQLISIPAVC